MSIVRVAKNSNYVVMNRTALNDKRLSWRAKGIMAYLLSMPDDWVFYMEELQTHSTDGKTSFTNGFKELKDCGYVERRPVKDEDSGKITRWETIVHEIPIEVKPQVEKPHTGKPVSGKATDWNTIDRENHGMENPTLLSTDINQVLNVPSTDNKSTTAANKNALRFFQENIRFNLNSFEQETIIHWENEYPHELIIEAMKRTALANATALRYTESILIDWQKKRLTTLAEVERDDEAFNQKKGGRGNASNTRSNQPNRNEERDDFSL